MTHPIQISLRVLWSTLWLLGGAYILWAWWQTSGSLLTSDNSDAVLIALGRIAGLLSGYLILWQLVLMSRLPILERAFNHNWLAELHRWNGAMGLWLLLAHIACLHIGYATLNNSSILVQFIAFQLEWKDVLVATFGFALLVAVGVMSAVIVRRRLKYETWYAVHTTTYLAIALAVSHQLSVGSDIVADKILQFFWIMMYIFAFGSIALYRMGLPLYQLYKHRFTVKRVQAEAPGVISIYLSGNNLKQFKYTAGQYAIWRFLTPDLWLQSHPFSFSCAPNGDELRLTVKAVGDFTRSLQAIKPGALVLIDGPHGDFTLPSVKRKQSLLFIAGGIGITPIRAMIEALPPDSVAPILIYAARTKADLALRSELETLITNRAGRVYYALSQESRTGFHAGTVAPNPLAQLVPDIASRTILLCGPPPMMQAVRNTLKHLKVPSNHIHSERFSFLKNYKSEQQAVKNTQ